MNCLNTELTLKDYLIKRYYQALSTNLFQTSWWIKEVS